VSKIQEELVNKTGLATPKTEEARPKFLVTMMKTVNRMANPTFDKLSKQTQDWANQANELYDRDKPVPDFPDYKPAKADAKADTKKAAAKEPERAPAKQAVKAVQRSEDKPGKSAPADKPKLRKLTDGAPVLLKQMILKSPDITTGEIVAELKKQGVKVSPLYVQTQRNDFRHSLRVLQHARLLKRDYNV
jgi:hypothetical protein